MTNEGIHQDNFRRAEQELIDLKKYWHMLAWWERDVSLEAVFDYISDIEELPEYAARCAIVQEVAEELAFQNEANYPSDEELAADKNMSLYYLGKLRLPHGQAVKILKAFTPEQVEAICFDEVDYTVDTIIDAMFRSTAAFFAVRNSIGHVAQSSHVAYI
ncbi:hypothetical protein [Methanolobus tindarius]|uniref:hypothetical protein n=1 Tax=Methanolobus tindarius TaxID=2221 RepID=UPI00064E660E|nr:hypothetical protein [Methanolobus tindarius]